MHCHRTTRTVTCTTRTVTVQHALSPVQHALLPLRITTEFPARHNSLQPLHNAAVFRSDTDGTGRQFDAAVCTGRCFIYRVFLPEGKTGRFFFVVNWGPRKQKCFELASQRQSGETVPHRDSNPVRPESEVLLTTLQ